MELGCRLNTPLGPVLLSAEDGALTGLRFVGQRYSPGEPPALVSAAESPVFLETAAWLEAYFSGGAPAWSPPLCPRGTPFRLSVWEALRAIPYGETLSYGELAANLTREHGGRVSARAVGGAVGRNPISLLIPCHRVLGADGSLTGYAGGVERKRLLLLLEQGRPLL